MNPASLLGDAARRHTAGVAVRCGDLALGYPDLLRLSGTMARAFEREGASPGDRVAALFPNCHLYLAAYFAALTSGVVLVPLNTRLHPHETAAILRHSGARLLFGDARLIGPLFETEPGLAGPGAAGRGGEGWALAALAAGDNEPGDAAGAEAALLYYTSGTTGRPKGVVLTRDNLAAHTAMTVDQLGFDARDAWLHAAPMFHLADAWAVWTTTAVGGTHVMLPRFDPAVAMDRIGAHGVTITNLVPTMLRSLLAESERRRAALPSLRLLLSGGAPIAPRTVVRIQDCLGCEYAQTYGLTETSPFLTFSLLDDDLRRLPPEEQARYRARTGRAVKGIELRVVQPAGADRFADVAPDDASVGEVVVRGPTVTPGYWRDEQATRDAFRGGWFHTGDLGTIDERGFLNLVDRAKDVVITGGETVYSTEVENVLYEHPAVREAAVFGVPDERWGELVRAAVVSDGARRVTAEELIAFCRAHVAHYKCPRAIDLVEALPRTGSGKIDKKALRAPFWRGRDRGIN